MEKQHRKPSQNYQHLEVIYTLPMPIIAAYNNGCVIALCFTELVLKAIKNCTPNIHALLGLLG